MDTGTLMEDVDKSIDYDVLIDTLVEIAREDKGMSIGGWLGLASSTTEIRKILEENRDINGY